eukprot:TCALIF_11993-PA protein Name:"Similar to grid2 Glutamate receptor ionotropic, delta-2 (Danio rerio)" AED:0.26 eAED:0.28 QI:0/-1/0/1/-1/1/1/0/466
MILTLEASGAFREKHIQWMFPHGTQFDFKLRLDSRVYIYEYVTDKIFIHEVYDILNYSRVCQEIGSYPDNMEFKSLVTRRRNLKGVTLRAGQVDFVAMGRPEFQGQFGGQHFDSLEKMMNFSTVSVFPKSGTWGTYFPNGEWNGVVGLLKEGEIDISMEILSSTEDREDFLTMAVAISSDIVTLVSKASRENKANVWSYLEILTIDVWIAYAGTMGFATYIISWAFSNYWLDSLGQLSQMSLMLSSSVTSREWSQQVAFLSIFTSCFLVFTFYTALLTSTMTYSTAPNEINSFEDVHLLGYKVVCVESSMIQQLLTSPNTTQELKKLSQVTVFYPLGEAENILDRMDKVVGLTITDQRFSDEGLVSIGDQTYTFEGSYAFPKNTDMKEVFDSALVKLKEFGLIPPVPQIPHIRTLQNIASNEPVALEIAHIGLLFGVLALGILLSFTLLLLEVLQFTRYNGSRKFV